MIIKLVNKALPGYTDTTAEVEHLVAVERIDRASFNTMDLVDDKGATYGEGFVDLLVNGVVTRIWGDHREAIEKALELAHMTELRIP